MNSENKVSTRDSWGELYLIKNAKTAEIDLQGDFNVSETVSKNFNYFLSAIKPARLLENFGAFQVDY
jgi:hypothetical protein